MRAFHELAGDHAVGKRATAQFDEQAVQLFYQIALIGYRDMQIVPDPKSGFEMTLLRMLAFAPDEDSAGRIPVAVAQPAQADGTSGEPGPVQAQTPAPESSARFPDGTAWHEAVESLEISGVARMLAEHSVLVGCSAETVELQLDVAHDTLLDEPQQQAIERALCEQMGASVKLKITVGTIQEESPAARREREAAERQRNAEAILESDQTVQSLLNEFGGRLGAVKPLDDAAR